MLSDKEIRQVIAQGEDAILKLIKQLQENIVTLEKRVTELESKLNKNSQNSSKPPSTDIVKYKVNNSREKTTNQPGGQPGHEPHGLKFSSKPDEIIIHRVNKCQHCHRTLRKIPVLSLEKRQLLEIPEIKLSVIEHQSEIKKCPDCKKLTKGDFPEELSKTVQYGNRVCSFLTACQNYMLLPYRRTAEFFNYLFGQSISEGTIKNINKRFYNRLEPTESIIKQSIIESKTINEDESGVYINGRRDWIHCSSTPEFTFYQIDQNRGHEAIEKIGIIPAYRGNLITDYYKTYLLYTDCKHFLCNAHHLRELKYITEIDSEQKWAGNMIEFLKSSKACVDKAKVKGKDHLSRYMLNNFSSAYDRIILKASKENPENNNRTHERGKIKQTPSRNLFKRFRDHKNMVLGFLYDFNVPFDNNQAERDIRMIKVKQKVSGCFRSEDGGKYFCRIRGYISTVRKQGLNIFDALASVLFGKPLLNFSP
jgi:transposase